MNYRICIARSGSYYVQRRGVWAGDWKMVGPFFRTKRGAENFIYGAKSGCCGSERVIGYY